MEEYIIISLLKIILVNWIIKKMALIQKTIVITSGSSSIEKLNIISTLVKIAKNNIACRNAIKTATIKDRILITAAT